MKKSSLIVAGISSLAVIILIGPLLRSHAAEQEPRTSVSRQMQAAVVERRDVKGVARLLDSGADPNSSIGCGDWPPLLGAIEHRDIPMATLLLKRGARVSDTAMLRACNTADRDLALPTLLVSHGGNVNCSRCSFDVSARGRLAR